MKWLHNLLKGASLTTALFIFQACYGMPQPALYAEDGKLYVDHTPACSVILRFDTRRTGRVLSLHDDITHSEFDLSGDYRHFRLEVKDIHGNKALTRAYTKADIE